MKTTNCNSEMRLDTLINEKDGVEYDKAIEMVNSLNIYREDIGRIPVLSKEEELELVKKMVNGDEEARNKLIESNLRLVFLIIFKYFDVRNDDRLLDFIQNGNIGLIKATEKFNLKLGCRFCSFAGWYIRREINARLRDYNSSLSVSIFASGLLTRVNNYIESYKCSYNSIPTTEQIVSKFNLPVSSLRVLKCVERAKNSVNVSSIQDNEFEDFDTIYTEDSIESLEDKIQYDEIKKISRSILTTREYETISLRYGFEDGKYRLIKEIAEILGLSTARVGELELIALKKIKEYMGIMNIETHRSYKKKKTKKKV